MAYSQYADFSFMPFLSKNFQPRGPIQAGVQGTSPYRKGVTDLALNSNTLWAQSGHVLVNDTRDDTNTVSATLATPFSFAYYKIQIPSYAALTSGNQRKKVLVYVRAGTSTGNWTITATTPEGSATSISMTTGVQWATVAVECTRDGVELIELEMTCAATCTATVYAVTMILQPEDVETDLILQNDVYEEDVYVPLEENYYIAEAPLTVVGIQHLEHNNETLYRDTVRTVVSYCVFDNLGSSYTGTDNLCVTSDVASGALEPLMEWVYFPRQGVKNLQVYVNGRVAAWASSADNADFTLGFKGAPDLLSFSLASASCNFASWPVDGSLLSIPNAHGPLFLSLYGTDRGKRAYIQAICIIEEFV